tara:strand:+ start:123 stop:713 length:591 start_codon:yes stop_codon:yes gene_type:complete
VITSVEFRQLVWTSITNPADGAEEVMRLKPGREALWTGLLLMAALNTALLVLSNILIPGPWPLPGILANPLVYMGVVAGFLTVASWMVWWTGRLLGGQGSFEDILCALVWLQVLRVCVQVVATVLLMVSPLISGVFGVAAGVYGLYVGLHFINVAHRFYSLGRAALALVAAGLALVVAMSILLTMLGFPGVETANV